MTNSGRFSLTDALNLFSWRQSTSELIVWFLGSSSKDTTPFQSHHKDSIIFFLCNSAFDVICGGSSRLGHAIVFKRRYCKQFIFRSLQNSLNRKTFNNDEALKSHLVQFFADKDKKFYERGIMKLSERWQKVIEQNGKYIID